MLEEGGLTQLVSAAGSMDAGLRLNGMWALQNLAHGAQPQLKAQLMAALPWPTASACLCDSDPTVKVRQGLLWHMVLGFSLEKQALQIWHTAVSQPSRCT